MEKVFPIPPRRGKIGSSGRVRKSIPIFLAQNLYERRRNMRIVNWMVVFLLIFAFGCATTQEGKMIDQAKLKQLQLGKTKTMEVEQLFGKPDKVEPMGKGEVKYTYDYCKTEPMLFTLDPQKAQRLEVMIKGGRVQTYKLTSEEKEPIL